MVSATEWAASASIAAAPETRPATPLAMAITRLATMATSTVRRVSDAMRGGYPR